MDINYLYFLYANHVIKSLNYLVNGNWGPWIDGECGVTCGVGSRARSRNCDSPAAQHGGEECAGSRLDVVPCDAGPCPSKLRPEQYK